MKDRFWKIVVLLNFLLACFCLSLLLPSCGAGVNVGTGTLPTVGPTMAPTNIRIPACNVLFRPLNVAQAADDGVNTDIKVYADQVVIDTEGNALQSTNLQTALNNEIAPDLATILPGTWQTKYYNDRQIFEGTTTFNADGTFSCDKGGAAFLSISFGNSEYPTTFKTYTIDANNVIKLVYDRYDTTQPPDLPAEFFENESVYLPVSNFNSSRITLSGSRFANKLDGN